MAIRLSLSTTTLEGSVSRSEKIVISAYPFLRCRVFEPEEVTLATIVFNMELRTPSDLVACQICRRGDKINLVNDNPAHAGRSSQDPKLTPKLITDKVASTVTPIHSLSPACKARHCSAYMAGPRETPVFTRWGLIRSPVRETRATIAGQKSAGHAAG